MWEHCLITQRRRGCAVPVVAVSPTVAAHAAGDDQGQRSRDVPPCLPTHPEDLMNTRTIATIALVIAVLLLLFLVVIPRM